MAIYGREQMSGVGVDAANDCLVKLTRQLSDASTAAAQSPPAAFCRADPCEPVAFRRLESWDKESSAEEDSCALSEPQELEPLWQDVDEAPRLALGLPPLRSELGRWAQWAVSAEEWQSRTLGEPAHYVYPGGGRESPTDNESTEAGDDFEEADWAPGAAPLEPLWRDFSEPPRICLGLPPMRSDLGRWAQWATAAETWQSEALGVPVRYVHHRGAGRGLVDEGCVDPDGVDPDGVDPDRAAEE